LKNILHKKLYKKIRESFDISSQTVQEIRDVVVEAIIVSCLYPLSHPILPYEGRTIAGEDCLYFERAVEASWILQLATNG